MERCCASRSVASLCIAVVALPLAGCSAFVATGCRTGEQRAANELLYFGTGKPGGGSVSTEEWAAFLNASVTTRFPAGHTVWPATGQWRSGSGSITTEGSYVLSLLHPQTPAAEASVQAIVDEYKARFQQEAVLRVRTQACTSL